MSPPRRRSARLASATPKGKAAPGLSSVQESNEPQYPELPRLQRRIAANETQSSPARGPTTPVSSAVKPPRSEMHPSKFHSTMGPPSSALTLGFTDIRPVQEGDDPELGALNATPSKINRAPSSSFDFSVARDSAELGLSSDAQRIMDELRSQAEKIRVELVAQREAEGESDQISRRVFAKPKGRFSAAHHAEFSKMESIENHASAWRAQNGRFTPVKSLKRSPSKANLDGTPTSVRSVRIESPCKLDAENASTKPIKAGLKRTSSVANMDNTKTPPAVKRHGPRISPSKARAPIQNHMSPIKRLKQNQGDDISSNRPKPSASSLFSGDKLGQTTPGRLTQSQSQSSLGRASNSVTSSKARLAEPQKSAGLFALTPSKSKFGGLTKSATTQNLASPSRTADFTRRIISPGSLQKVKSILTRKKPDLDVAKTAIPFPAANALTTSQTPAPPRTEKELPPLPLTTPRRKLTKRVTFTPDTKRAVTKQDTPSPKKAGIFKGFSARLAESRFAGLDGVLAKADSDDVVYPDLSGLKHLVEDQVETQRRVPSVPGKFTFRSDHTIQLGGASPAGFGACPGQSSVRHVRGSLSAADMPGSFPAPPSPSTHPNKENKAPTPSKMLAGVPHGMSNKKRHRAGSDDEDEEANHASKKRKNGSAPGDHVLVATRPIGTTPKGTSKAIRAGSVARQTPTRTPGRAASRTPSKTPNRTQASASPTKKGAALSLSRLNMLARPKNRV